MTSDKCHALIRMTLMVLLTIFMAEAEAQEFDNTEEDAMVMVSDEEE